MGFSVPPEWASAAISECAREVIDHRPQPGVARIFKHGSGVWTINNYFNCGCNQVEGTPPGVGNIGTLSRVHLDGLKESFLEKYAEYKPNVLPPAAGKWNFTLVKGVLALNFHMEEE
jgi:hypothetical protein